MVPPGKDESLELLLWGLGCLLRHSTCADRLPQGHEFHSHSHHGKKMLLLHKLKEPLSGATWPAEDWPCTGSPFSAVVWAVCYFHPSEASSTQSSNCSFGDKLSYPVGHCDHRSESQPNACSACSNGFRKCWGPRLNMTMNVFLFRFRILTVQQRQQGECRKPSNRLFTLT